MTATNPDQVPRPDTIEPQSPQESPEHQTPTEQPMQQPDEVNPTQPDQIQPGVGPNEAPMIRAD